MEWISVKDKLPALDEDVVVCVNNKYIKIMSLSDLNAFDREYLHKELEVDYLWQARDYQFEMNEITHWALLPEPPEAI